MEKYYMLFYKQLYASDSLKTRRRSIAWKLKNNIFMPSVYVIALSEGSDLLDIYHKLTFRKDFEIIPIF